MFGEAGSVTDQVAMHHPDGVDALVNLAGNSLDQIPVDAVKRGGVVSFTTMGPDEDALAEVGLVGRKVMGRASREVTAPSVAKVADGSIKVGVAEVLDHAAEGLATLAAASSSSPSDLRVRRSVRHRRGRNT